MSERTIGWLFVASQAVLLGLLALAPSRTDYRLHDTVRSVVDVAFWIGVTLVVIAGVSLGRALTATPVPTAAGTLRTNGLYRLVRHPIYTGVIVIVIAMATRSQSFFSIGIGVVTIIFFHAKTTWEEQRLAAAYPAYGEYAARTPRFIPFAKRRSASHRDRP